MPLNHGQGNLGGEARGNDTGSSTRDSHPSGRKRKTVFQEAEINQSSQTWEQSYATFTPDDSDGEATGLGGVEIRGDYHIFKKHKATTESLLSGTHMEELCVVIPPVINSPSASSATFPAITSDQHLSAGESKPSSTSTQTRPVRHLVNDCVGNAASVTPKQKGHTNARARAGLSGKSSDEISDTLDGSDNVTDGSFVIVASHNDPGVQLIPARTDSAPSSHNHIPATRSQTARPSPRHEGEKATHTNELKVAENTRERSTGGGLKGLIAQSHDQGPADAYESRERMMRAGGTHGPALPENDAQAPSDSRSKPDDREYEFVEHPEPRRIQKFREVAAIVREPDGVEHPVKVHFDNCADSNFISSSIVKALRFKERPLPGRDRVTYEALIGEYTPIMYVVLYLRLRGVSEHYRESFRVVESDAFELIVGAATIEKRKIPLQEQTGMSAFPSFKKEPTKEQAAEQQASWNRDRQVALELSKNIPPYKKIPPATQSSQDAKDDPRNTPNSSSRTSTYSTTSSGSTSTSSSSKSLKTRPKG